MSIDNPGPEGRHLHFSGRTFFLGLFIILFISSCAPPWGSQTLPTLAVLPSLSSITSTPFQPEGTIQPAIPTETPQVTIPTATGTSALQVPLIWISPSVPNLLRQDILEKTVTVTNEYNSTQIHLNVQTGQVPGNDESTSIWYYAVAAPFPTIIDDVRLSDIQNSWQGNPSGPFANQPIGMDENTLAAFSLMWGDPANGSVTVLPEDQLIVSSWASQPSWAIIPFEDIQPRWKVLSIDGQSPLRNDFTSANYPLKITFQISPPAISLPSTNRDPARLTVLAMTGVTALVRGTADRMEKLGILYPGEEVRTVLRAADITHISNEISFKSDCPFPDPWTESLQFCSNPTYIALLEDVGTDIVELTGNHLMDYSAAELLMTLSMYDAHTWKYYGGGLDLQSAQAPILIEHNGNKLAFIGCNYVGPGKDWATDSSPGSAICNFDLIQSEITNLVAIGYIPIMTFQYEELYSSLPGYREKIDFRRVADMGAVIISGSQSHVPAAMEFYDGSFIHYGLGNLFFDQMSHLMPDGSIIYDTRNLFIDRHVFYDGKYLGVELLTYKIENYARPRPMTESERVQFLADIFQAAGW